MFQKATKQASRLRLGLCGTSGSGKTYTALSIATHLATTGRIAVVDTEHGSAAKYSDEFDFDVLNLDTFEPEKFVGAIRAAQKGGYDVIILDSLSHAWMGTGGTLDQVEEAKRRSGNNNGFAAWRDASKAHTELIEAIIHARIHVIATMRSKTEYVLDESGGKKVPRKVGMAPVQRDGMEYEFDVVGDMQDGTLVVTKSRCPALSGKSFFHPGEALADVLNAWLGDGPMPLDRADLDARFKAGCESLGLNARNEAKALQKDTEAKAWKDIPDTILLAVCERMEAQAEEPPAATEPKEAAGPPPEFGEEPEPAQQEIPA